MALIRPTLVQPQFGAGKFEALSAFDGLLGQRFAWGTTWGITLPNIDEALAQLSGGAPALPMVSGSSEINLFSQAGQQMLVQIGKGLTATQPAAAEHWVTRAWALDGIGAAIERVAEDQVHTRKVITRKTAPRRIIEIIRPNVKANVKPALEAAARAEHRAEAAQREAARLRQQVNELSRAVLRPNAGIVVGLPPRVGLGERDIERIKAGLRKVSKYGSLAFFLALLLKALEKAGLNWIRCRNVKQFGKALCGLSPNILNALLGASALIVGTVSIVQFAEFMLDTEKWAVPELTKGIRELKGIKTLQFTGYTGTLG